MTRRIFNNGDVFFAEDANAIAYPIPDGQDFIGHGPQVVDEYLSNEPVHIKSKFYSFYDRLKVSHQSGLTFSYLGGTILLSNGNLVAIGAGTIQVPDNSSVFIYVNNAGSVQQSVSLPNESFPLARVSTASGTISGTIIDLRDKVVDRISPSNIPEVVLIPTGMIAPFGGNSAPTGWLICDGTEYSINSYPALFTTIGVNYGGNGTTTFRVPDLRGRSPLGAGQGAGLTNRTIGQSGGLESVTLNTTQIPSHSHGIIDSGHSHSLNDPRHSHTINDPGHNHSFYDPGHNHGVNDPSHNHQIYANTTDGEDGARHRTDGFSKLTNVAITGEDVGGKGYINNNANGVILIANSYTNISIRNQGTGITLGGSTTGASLNSASTGITLNNSSTGITLTSQGGGGSHENMSPYLAVNYIIKI